MAIAVGVAIPLLAQTPGGPPRADPPQLKVGDRWKWERTDSLTGNVIRTTERTVTAVSPTQIESIQNDGKHVSTAELNAIETPEATLDASIKGLSFPLEVGKKWKSAGKITVKTPSATGEQQFDVSVDSYEKITVRAGTFDAYKITSQGYITFRQGRQVNRTYWYAPEARAIVKFQNDDRNNRYTDELIELKLAP